jgi:3-methyladenine DNA glycosylase AlkD
MKKMVNEIVKELNNVSSKEKAEILQRFFKTGKGEYGEGDRFIGVVVPDIRKLCKKYYKTLKFDDLDFFVKNSIHEYRLFGLLVLTYQYEKANEKERKEIFDYYLRNSKYVNNWDLVDLTAPKIVGEYLKEKDRSVLYKLVKRKNLWEQRIAILSTFTFIRDNQFVEILDFSAMLINHKHDLIHKALGWMLREVGKREKDVLISFLDTHASNMPRVMLRYAIEKLSEEERKIYLLKKS